MNNEKAREFFTAYFEGTLEAGLQQSLEQKLRTNPELAADYAAFVETMHELDAMKFEEIEVPSYLSDRIATRIEQVTDRNRSLAPAWMGWLRGLALGGVATAAIVLAISGVVNMRSNAPVAEAGLVSGPGFKEDHLTFNYKDNKVMLEYRPTSAKTVVVSSGVTGKEMQRFALDGKRLESALENSLADTALFDVQVLGEVPKTTIAVPGTKRSSEKSGSGDVKEFAAALAGFYRVPVQIEVQNTAKPVRWDFGQPDAREAATAAVGSEGFSVDERPSGLIVILDR